ncbi:MAG TPA: CoA transferase [Chloroflexota bacterium]|nr:CoA transferase [Chloroflexota bacterium]
MARGLTEATAPLEGVSVVELSGHVAGPYTGMLLGDLGADVLKVEPPTGDTHRGRNPKHELYSPSFRALNRNKKSLTLDLGTEQGRAIVLRMLDAADVLVENFRPATRSRLGLDFADLRRRNPRLIHCSISGFGQSGPYKDRPGFDTLAQALSGMLSLVSDVREPLPVGVSIADHVSGVFGAYGVLAALYARERTAEGQFVDVSLLRSSLAFIESHVADFLNGGEAVDRANFVRGRIYSLKGRDGRTFIVHLGAHDRAWQALCRGLGREELGVDERFARWQRRYEQHAEVQAMLQALAGERPRAHWLAALEAEGVPCAPANTLEEAFDDPQVRHLGLPREVDGSRLVGEAVHLSATPAGIRFPAPHLGEHTDEVLQLLGYDGRAISALREQGVI